MDRVKAAAPATVSNVVCGFDCLGFALSEPCEEVDVGLIDEPVVRITHLDDFGLSTDPKKNVIGAALEALSAAAGYKGGFDVRTKKEIMPGSGIGSSAASACGAAVAANALLDHPFPQNELTRFAIAGERLASGAAHADNAAPCIYGGFVLVRSLEPLDIVTLETPPLWAAVLHPQIEIRTSDARRLLPRELPLGQAVDYWRGLGAFVAALSKGDLDLLARAMDDKIIEPVRRPLIPKFDEMKYAGLAAGAIGGGISGSGPSVFMLSENAAIAREAAAAMAMVFEPAGIPYKTYVSAISDGVKLV